MGARKNDDNVVPLRRAPATSPEGREQQLVSTAIDLAEQQMLAGTASSAVIVHYLKLGSSTEFIEQRLKEETIKLSAMKTEAIAAEKRTEEKIQAAMEAFKSYSPTPDQLPTDTR